MTRRARRIDTSPTDRPPHSALSHSLHQAHYKSVKFLGLFPAARGGVLRIVQSLRPEARGEPAQGHLLEALPSRPLASVSPAIAIAAPACTPGRVSPNLPHMLTLVREAPEVGDTPWSLLLPPPTKPRAEQSSGCAWRPGVGGLVGLRVRHAGTERLYCFLPL